MRCNELKQQHAPRLELILLQGNDAITEIEKEMASLSSPLTSEKLTEYESRISQVRTMIIEPYRLFIKFTALQKFPICFPKSNGETLSDKVENIEKNINNWRLLLNNEEKANKFAKVEPIINRLCNKARVSKLSDDEKAMLQALGMATALEDCKKFEDGKEFMAKKFLEENFHNTFSQRQELGRKAIEKFTLREINQKRQQTALAWSAEVRKQLLEGNFQLRKVDTEPEKTANLSAEELSMTSEWDVVVEA